MGEKKKKKEKERGRGRKGRRKMARGSGTHIQCVPAAPAPAVVSAAKRQMSWECSSSGEAMEWEEHIQWSILSNQVPLLLLLLPHSSVLAKSSNMARRKRIEEGLEAKAIAVERKERKKKRSTYDR